MCWARHWLRKWRYDSEQDLNLGPRVFQVGAVHAKGLKAKASGRWVGWGWGVNQETHS